jgi:hypothetical protein
MSKTKGKRTAVAIATLALFLLFSALWLSWPYLVFWYRFKRVGTKQQGFPEFRHWQSGILFVPFPSGTLLIRSSDQELEDLSKPIKNWRTDWADRETPQHEVRLSPFLIAEYELTQERRKKLNPENPAYARKGSGGFPDLQPTYRTGELLVTQIPREETALDEITAIVVSGKIWSIHGTAGDVEWRTGPERKDWIPRHEWRA